MICVYVCMCMCVCVCVCMLPTYPHTFTMFTHGVPGYFSHVHIKWNMKTDIEVLGKYGRLSGEIKASFPFSHFFSSF